MEKSIKDFSDIELKAIKSDIYEDMKKLQSTLQIINNELASRAQKAQEKPKMEENKVEGEVVETVETPVEATEEVTETVAEVATEDNA